MVFRSSCDLQSEQSQFRACGFVIRVKNAANPKTFRDLNEERGVFEIDNLPCRCLGDVQRQLENIRVRFPEMNEAGGNKSIHKCVQLELTNSMSVQFTRFVADDDNLQSIFGFQVANQFNHPGERFRLREHETSKLVASERALFEEDHAV